jgi:hypothetical protein
MSIRLAEANRAIQAALAKAHNHLGQSDSSSCASCFPEQMRGLLENPSDEIAETKVKEIVEAAPQLPGGSNARDRTNRAGVARSRPRLVVPPGRRFSAEPLVFGCAQHCNGTVLIVVHHIGAASNGGGSISKATPNRLRSHRPAPSRDRRPWGALRFPRGLLGHLPPPMRISQMPSQFSANSELRHNGSALLKGN